MICAHPDCSLLAAVGTGTPICVFHWAELPQDVRVRVNGVRLHERREVLERHYKRKGRRSLRERLLS